jgi:hypothetical protein
VDRACDACYKACSRDTSAAPEELGYSAERRLVALETLNERQLFPRVLWLVVVSPQLLDSASAAPYPRVLFRSLPQIAESGIPLRSRCQMRIGVPVLHEGHKSQVTKVQEPDPQNSARLRFLRLCRSPAAESPVPEGSADCSQRLLSLALGTGPSYESVRVNDEK